MAQEPENQKNAGLEELEELTQQDRISQIQFNEPELHSFNASDIFELKEEEKKKPPPLPLWQALQAQGHGPDPPGDF
ncbi:hypothetical protein [Faecalibaculum rodentium]|uniref:hypothetical protein n=1 Tax=Faecalibaculum rodentium TaxID=1702221 RepID=UPI0025866EF5|nr:hypothetical protein [Faecalibaculum rodentium]